MKKIDFSLLVALAALGFAVWKFREQNIGLSPSAKDQISQDFANEKDRFRILPYTPGVGQIYHGTPRGGGLVI